VSSSRGRNSLVLLVLILIITVLVFQFRSSSPQPERLFFNELAEKIKTGEVSRIIVDDNDLEIIFRNGESAFSRVEPTKTTVEQLLDLHAPTSPGNEQSGPFLWQESSSNVFRRSTDGDIRRCSRCGGSQGGIGGSC